MFYMSSVVAVVATVRATDTVSDADITCRLEHQHMLYWFLFVFVRVV